MSDPETRDDDESYAEMMDRMDHPLGTRPLTKQEEIDRDDERFHEDR